MKSYCVIEFLVYKHTLGGGQTDRVRDRDRENFDTEIYIKLIFLKSPCYQFKPDGSIFHMKRSVY